MYEEDGYVGAYYSAVCNSKSEFTEYLKLFDARYSSDGTQADDYGDVWYLYSSGGTYIDVCYYEYEGVYYADVDAYRESEGSGEGSGDSSDYKYSDFTAEEKAKFEQSAGVVIPFLPCDDYSFEVYEEDGYTGAYYSAVCNSKSEFTEYLKLFDARYSSDGTQADDYGDVWYLYSSGSTYIDVCYYEYEGVYYADVDAYRESEVSGEGSGGEVGSNVITNNGAGLPADDGDGVYDVDFTKAEPVKDVTDQENYLGGCPTVGSPAVLVIPVEFSDSVASSKGYSIDKIVNAFEKNGKTDYFSLYDYYLASSYGKLTLDVTVLDSWFRPSHASEYYYSQTIDSDGDEIEVGDQMVIDEALAYLENIMDLSKFDSDGNGTIDAIVIINTLDVSEESEFYWAYRYWNFYTDAEGYYYEYDGVSANDYLWMSYLFLEESYDEDGNAEYGDTDVLNTYTLIHEFGHILGAEDYYDTAYVDDPLDGCDIMDAMLGDHNAFTKFHYGWLTSSRLVVTDGSVTVSLDSFEESGDTLILANNWDDSLGAYQEYYLIVYYTATGLNGGDYGYFDRDGIVVYHVNASLYAEEYAGEMYYGIYNTNTDPAGEYGTDNDLIELVCNGDFYTYTVGDTLGTVTDDSGNTLGYSFRVDSLEDGVATLTVLAK